MHAALFLLRLCLSCQVMSASMRGSFVLAAKVKAASTCSNIRPLIESII